MSGETPPDAGMVDGLRAALAACEALLKQERKIVEKRGGNIDQQMRRAEKAEARVTKLTAALDQVLLSSLLRIRQAAFGPEIGVRYTEAIRSEIANECRRLEDFIRAALAGSEDSCAHEWVDARNEVVESGEMCPKCGAFRAGSEDSPFGPPSCNEPRKRGGDVRAKPTSGGGPNPLASVPIWQLESQVCDALYRELDAEATEGAEEALCEIVRRAGSEDS